jgi:hypothetical protein
MVFRSVSLIAVIALALSTIFPAAAAEHEECWKATFSEQLSGPVHELGPSDGGNGYTNSYDGDFKWRGKPASLAIASEYVFCFSGRIDSGGILHANGKRIELDRIGSIRRPPLLHEGVFRSYSSTRDARDFPALYGVFSTPGKPDTSLEIQLEPLRGTATVVASTRDADKRRVVSYMRGPALRVDAQAPSSFGEGQVGNYQLGETKGDGSN